MNHLLYITYGENSGNVYRTQVIELLNSWIKKPNWKVSLIQVANDEMFEGLDEKVDRVFIKRKNKILLGSDIKCYCKEIIETDIFKHSDKIYFNSRGYFAYNISLKLIEKYGINYKINNLDIRGISEELKYSISRYVLYPLINKYYKNTIKQASSITTVSGNLKTYLLDKYELKDNYTKIKVIPTLSIMQYKVGNNIKSNLAYVGKIAWIKKKVFAKKIKQIETLFLGRNWKIKIIGAPKSIKGLTSNGIIYVDRMSPSKLYSFLLSFHSGIVLRDSSIVNRVAAPCKISDYLCLGIPIIFSGEIGSLKDFTELYPDNAKYISNLLDLEKDKEKLMRFIAISEDDRKVLSNKAIAYFGVSSVVDSYIDYFMNND